MGNKEIIIHEKPELNNPQLVASFGGWPDAAHAGTATVSYLIRKLKPQKFAEIAAKEFYDLSTDRPTAIIDQGLIQSVKLPANNFFYWKGETANRDTVLLWGTEPNLKWQEYVDSILEFTKQLKINKIYLVGGLYDEIPHTREPKITGVVSLPHLREVLRKHDIEPLTYKGPSSLYSLLLATCRQREIEAVNLWGHAPFYVRTESNPAVCLALLRKLTELSGIEVDLEEMERAAEYLQGVLNKLLVENEELSRYIQKLEEQYEAEGGRPAGPVEGADRIIREVEDFLRTQRGEEDTPE